MNRKVCIYTKKGRLKFSRDFSDPLGVSDFIVESDWVNNKVRSLLGDIECYQKIGEYRDLVDFVQCYEFLASNSNGNSVKIVIRHEDPELHETKGAYRDCQ